jgi:hypothetical protein
LAWVELADIFCPILEFIIWLYNRCTIRTPKARKVPFPAACKIASEIIRIEVVDLAVVCYQKM